MLSPKMQRCVRVVDNQLLMLSDRARTDSTLTGNLHKKASDGGRWKNRYFVLYQVYIYITIYNNILLLYYTIGNSLDIQFLNFNNTRGQRIEYYD